MLIDLFRKAVKARHIKLVIINCVVIYKLRGMQSTRIKHLAHICIIIGKDGAYIVIKPLSPVGLAPLLRLKNARDLDPYLLAVGVKDICKVIALPHGNARDLHSALGSYHLISTVCVFALFKHSPLSDSNIILDTAHSTQVHLNGISACLGSKVCGIEVVITYKPLICRLNAEPCKGIIYSLLGSLYHLALPLGV